MYKLMPSIPHQVLHLVSFIALIHRMWNPIQDPLSEFQEDRHTHTHTQDVLQ